MDDVALIKQLTMDPFPTARKQCVEYEEKGGVWIFSRLANPTFDISCKTCCYGADQDIEHVDSEQHSAAKTLFYTIQSPG